MAQKLVYTSDLSGKPIDEKDLRSLRITDHEGTVWRIDATQTELDKLLGTALENATDVSSEVQDEQNARYSRFLQSKIDDGTVVRAEDVRSPMRKARSDSGSGLAPEEMKACRAWWQEQGKVGEFEARERGRIPAVVVSAWTEAGKPGA